MKGQEIDLLGGLLITLLSSPCLENCGGPVIVSGFSCPTIIPSAYLQWFVSAPQSRDPAFSIAPSQLRHETVWPSKRAGRDDQPTKPRNTFKSHVSDFTFRCATTIILTARQAPHCPVLLYSVSPCTSGTIKLAAAHSKHSADPCVSLLPRFDCFCRASQTAHC
ncbi:hypothetical protein BT67DRAFT_26686 [Trichocladium antarcticum]|uniref:Secreted protein n=1 Tax=Trichocladium antarcticum TaxID=1450529 RepID=A0AAN6UTE8_9PEZI|nr:hypothetical protein BT67DRAFT_26686 [Trichocladium antarcticum]